METKYLKNWQQRIQKQKAQDRKRAQLAKKALPEAIKLLKHYGAKRIILFGSLCDGNRFRSHSDIDLAVEGIAEQDFCRASADLMMTLDWPIDLKPIEELEEFFKQRILKRGKVLYER